jgi:hypothetical protein
VLIHEFESRIPEWRENREYSKILDSFSLESSIIWPHFFEIESLPPIPEAPLIEMPKTRKFESVTNFLSKHSIKGETVKTLPLSQSGLN